MDQTAAALVNGMGMAFQPSNLVFIFIGTIWGMIGGALPGISSTVTLALIVPFTFGLSVEQGIMLMAGAWTASKFGNNIPAILIRTPGTSDAVLIVEEGYRFQARGEGSRALGITIFSSTIGQYVGIFVFILMVIPLSNIAVNFLYPEIFALSLWGLSAVAALSGKNPVKGLVAAAFGVGLSTIGVDPVTAQSRFAFGTRQFSFGLDLIAVLMGLLALSEVLRSSRQMTPWKRAVAKLSVVLPSWADLKYCMRPISIGSIIGVIVGIMPGAGASAASFITYTSMRHLAKHPEEFGKGSVEALAAVDSSNNAVQGGEAIPTLGLGIPGGVSAAVLMGALMVKGITPGPLLMQRNPEVISAFFGALIVCTLAGALVYYLMIVPSIYITSLSRSAVMAATLALTVVGTYAMKNSLFDVWVALAFGVVGYFMYGYGYPVAAAALGMVLGPLIESNLRLGMLMARGDVIALVTRPITATLLLIAFLSFFYPLFQNWQKERRQRRAGPPDERATAEYVPSGER